MDRSSRAEVCNFIKKETLAQVLSCELCEISKNTFFTNCLLFSQKTSIIVFNRALNTRLNTFFDVALSFILSFISSLTRVATIP